jgi:hypothetical protein
MESICAASSRLARILLSTATMILAGGLLFSPSADLISDAPGNQSRLHVVATRDGLEDLLAPATSYSFAQFCMRVQYLLLTAPFLEGIAEALVAIRRRHHAFKGMAESELCHFWFPACDDAYKASLFT